MSDLEKNNQEKYFRLHIDEIEEESTKVVSKKKEKVITKKSIDKKRTFKDIF